MREELDESAWAIDAAPVSPILFKDKFNEVREELDESARTMAVAPVSPILLPSRSNLVRVGSLRARPRS